MPMDSFVNFLLIMWLGAFGVFAHNHLKGLSRSKGILDNPIKYLNKKEKRQWFLSWIVGVLILFVLGIYGFITGGGGLNGN